MDGKRALALIGGGHAHLEVLQQLAKTPVPDLDVALYDPSPVAYHAGMVPGVIAGHYEAAQARVNLWALCQRARVRFIQSDVLAVDADGQRLDTATGLRHRYDFVSFCIGGIVKPLTVIEGTYAINSRPLDPLLQAILERESVRTMSSLAITVIGGGAQGLETALALAWRWRESPHRRITIVTRRQLLNGFPASAQRVALHACQRLGVEVIENTPIRQINPTHLVLTTGEHIESQLTLLATGYAPAPLLNATAVAHSPDGSLAVTPHLRSSSHAYVFAAGDCASVMGYTIPKSAPYAMQQGTILFQNLMAALANKPFPATYPTNGLPHHISLGEQRALTLHKGICLSGQWIYHWKHRSNLRWIGKFNLD